MKIFITIKLLLFTLLSPIYVHASHSNQGILVFLDDTEGIDENHLRVSHSSGPLAAISYDFRLALSQKASPILASKNLLANLFRVHTMNELSSQEWEVKEVNPSLVLLLHANYLKDMDSLSQDVQANNLQNSPDTYSQIEKKLGLKVNHLANSSFQDIQTKSHTIRQQARKNKFADYFVKSLPDIFVPKLAYGSGGRETLWSIYMAGHGEAGLRLTALSINGFIGALDFFETYINTHVVLYMSCFGGGLTQQMVYGHRKLKFPIIAQVIGDVVGHLPWSATEFNKGASSKRFDNFIKAVAGNIDYPKAWEHIIPLQPEALDQSEHPTANFAEASRWSDIPSIREAYTDYFHVLVGKDCLMAVGGPQEAIFEEERFISNKPKGLLVYTNDIPFELKLDDPNFEVIISMVPGRAVHRIKKVSSLTKTLPELLQLFMRIDPSDASHHFVPKKYLLEEVSDRDDNIFNNVIIEIKNNRWEAYFSQNNKHYKLDSTINKSPISIIDNWSFNNVQNAYKDCFIKESQSPHWSKASFDGAKNKFHLNEKKALEELALGLKSTLAFHSRNQARTKALISQIDPNIEIEGLSLIEWIIKYDSKEINFHQHQAFRLELLEALLKSGAKIKNADDLVKQAVLDLVDPRIIRVLVEQGASLNVNEKFCIKGRENYALLYWVLDKVKSRPSEGFKERQAVALPLIKYLVEQGASIDEDDVIRSTLFHEMDEDIILYLLDNTEKISDIYELGTLQYAIEKGYSLPIIKGLVEKGANVEKVKFLHGRLWWELHLIKSSEQSGRYSKEAGAAEISEFLLGL